MGQAAVGGLALGLLLLALPQLYGVGALSYGTIYTAKLLRRGTDIDRTTPWRALSADGHEVQGWVTASGVLDAIARQITATQPRSTQAELAADGDHADPDPLRQHPPRRPAP